MYLLLSTGCSRCMSGAPRSHKWLQCQVLLCTWWYYRSAFQSEPVWHLRTVPWVGWGGLRWGPLPYVKASATTAVNAMETGLLPACSLAVQGPRKGKGSLSLYAQQAVRAATCACSRAVCPASTRKQPMQQAGLL